MLLVLIIVLSGCATKATDPIIGKWRSEDTPDRNLTFSDKMIPDFNNSIYGYNGTVLNWDGIRLYGVWKSQWNDSYIAYYEWRDPEYKELQPSDGVSMKYDHGTLYVALD